MENKKGRYQLIFDIPLEYRQGIKIRASRKNQSMKQWILSAINKKMEREDKGLE